MLAALIEAGCPISHAATVADLATFEQDDDGDYICVLGNCVGADDTSASDQLAENLVDDNAERNDRTARRGGLPTALAHTRASAAPANGAVFLGSAVRITRYRRCG